MNIKKTTPEEEARQILDLFTKDEREWMQWLSGPLHNDPEWSPEQESIAKRILEKMELLGSQSMVSRLTNIIVDARRNRALELLQVIRRTGMVDAFTMAIILHITSDKGQVYSEGVLVDIGCELDGPDLVMRLMSITEADIAVAIQTVGAFSQWQRTGHMEMDNEHRPIQE